MKLWLLVPVKPFSEGKSRLAETLDIDERAGLSRRLLRNVLQIARDSDLFAGILVISRDPAVLREAAEAGADVLLEQSNGLNLALGAARERAVEEGAEAVLILPSDLPLLESSDLERLLDGATKAPSVVIAPSHDGGTNALLLRPPYAIEFAFGRDSFSQHKNLAALAVLDLHVLESPTLAFDIDWPDDLRRLEEMERARTYNASSPQSVR